MAPKLTPEEAELSKGFTKEQLFLVSELIENGMNMLAAIKQVKSEFEEAAKPTHNVDAPTEPKIPEEETEESTEIIPTCAGVTVESVQEMEYLPTETLDNFTSMPQKIKQYTVNDLTTDLISQYICPDATHEEVFTFLQLCQYRGLNPFLREAYLIKYKGRPATMVVGKDFFMRKAEEHPMFNGFVAGVILLVNNELLYRQGQLVLKDDKLVGAWCEVFRRDRQYPYRSEVSMTEYNTGMSTWQKIPATMIRKVSIVQSLREAFPGELGGCYDAAEMGVLDDRRK